MKKLSKQTLLQSTTSPTPAGTSTKKKAKTNSSSFTPYHKSVTQSDMQIQMQRYSVGTNETPLAMQQNIEYFASSMQHMPE